MGIVDASAAAASVVWAAAGCRAGAGCWVPQVSIQCSLALCCRPSQTVFVQFDRDGAASRVHVRRRKGLPVYCAFTVSVCENHYRTPDDLAGWTPFISESRARDLPAEMRRIGGHEDRAERDLAHRK